MGGLTVSDVGGSTYALPTGEAISGSWTLGELGGKYSTATGAIVINSNAVLILEDLSGKPATTQRTIVHEILHISLGMGDIEMARFFKVKLSNPNDREIASAGLDRWFLNNCDPKLNEP